MARTRGNFLIVAGIILGGLAVVVGIRAVSNRAAARPDVAPIPSAAAVASQPTFSDRQLRAAVETVSREPSNPDGYNLLCAAYLKKARETGDFSFNARAEAALNRSFEVAAPEHNYGALKLQASLLLTYHRFNEALAVARRAQEARPEDHYIYGVLTDALVELGDYAGAFAAAQEMMDLRPGTSSYTRVSYLRELQGDVRGAIEAMRAATESAGDPETAAWCRTHLGELLLNAGELAAAEHELDKALTVLPDYHLALAAKARASLVAGNTDNAVRFYQRANQRVPLPDTAIALGNLYTKLGRPDEAKKQYDLVEFIERTGSNADTYSRQLALFYADHDMKLDDALQIMRRERAARSDIYTCDALAWALYKKGDLAGAKTSIDEALRLGTRDAHIHYHAGMIEHALGHKRDAIKHLQLALKINPAFDVLQADVARHTLRAMTD